MNRQFHHVLFPTSQSKQVYHSFGLFFLCKAARLVSNILEAYTVNRLSVCQERFSYSPLTKQTEKSNSSRCFNVLITGPWAVGENTQAYTELGLFMSSSYLILLISIIVFIKIADKQCCLMNFFGNKSLIFN